jgi:CRISPR type III-B/RAMP module RAMP protein Cmr1
MAKYDFTLELVSPAFIAGTDKARPEMRAPSIRGHLRYWARALLGATITDSKKLYEQESKAFGSTEEGSKFSIIVYPSSSERTGRVNMLPHREDSSSNPSPMDAVIKGKYRLRIATRPGQKVDDLVWDALKLWSLLGGLGRRSRRMFGAVSLMPDEGCNAAWYRALKTPEDIANAVDDILKKYRPINGSGVPLWPSFQTNYSWVIVGRESYRNYKEANQALFRELLRDKNKRYHGSGDHTFGNVQRGRRASTVHAQVRLLNNGFHPVLTAFLSQPNQNINQKLLSQFMKEATDHFDAVTVSTLRGW